jgi:hypothetical protein
LLLEASASFPSTLTLWKKEHFANGQNAHWHQQCLQQFRQIHLSSLLLNLLFFIGFFFHNPHVCFASLPDVGSSFAGS